MVEIIRIKNASYKRYEELLIKKEKLLKEAEEYRLLYDSVFGSLNSATHQAKIDCIKKRKTISYCQKIAAIGATINKKDLNEFVEKSMKDYEDTLSYLIGDEKGEEQINKYNTPENLKKIKRIYHQIAKNIHPDMNDNLKDDVIIQDLWNRACVAYNCNNLDELEELEILVNKYLYSLKHLDYDVDIPNVEEKIFKLNRKIEKILQTNPYQYKYILFNEESIENKKEELYKELNDYHRYSDELDKQIEEFHILEEAD